MHSIDQWFLPWLEKECLSLRCGLYKIFAAQKRIVFFAFAFRTVLRLHNLHRVAGDGDDRNDVEYSLQRLVRSARASAGASRVLPLAASTALPQSNRKYDDATNASSQYHRGKFRS